MPQCEKCGEIYMDTAGVCPACRKRKQRNFTIAVLVFFVVGAIAAAAVRIYLF